MAKRQSFADKASKKKHIMECPVCKSPITHTMFVIPTETDGSIKMKKAMIDICKCNYKQYYG